MTFENHPLKTTTGRPPVSQLNVVLLNHNAGQIK